MSKTKKAAIALCASLATSLLLGACGQKGPLYLPPKASLTPSLGVALIPHTIPDQPAVATTL